MLAVVSARNASPSAVPAAPNGQALVVANSDADAVITQALERIGYSSSVAPDPYAAAVEVVRRPLVFRAVVLSLAALYPEEVRLIDLIKQRFGHMEVFLADTVGRTGAVAEATRSGADAILVGDHLQRLGAVASGPARQAPREQRATIEGVLSADEIKALLE